MFVVVYTLMIYMIQCRSNKISFPCSSINQIKTELIIIKIRRLMKIIHKSKWTVTIYSLTEYSIKSCLSCKSFHYGLSRNKTHFSKFEFNDSIKTDRISVWSSWEEISMKMKLFCVFIGLIAINWQHYHCQWSPTSFFKKLVKRSNEMNWNRLDLINVQK
jgi:hypothetical protein